jgi:tetratricopeptide (TPR) repeat protein
MAIRCPIDGNPIDIPQLVNAFQFPDDISETMDLLEGRFNSIVHPICQERIPLLTEVTVSDKGSNRLLVINPNQDPQYVAEIEKINRGVFTVVVLADYNELRHTILASLDRYIVPALNVYFSDRAARPPEDETIELVSPFVLRVLKSSIDGHIPPFLKFDSSLTPDQASMRLKHFYTNIVVDHFDSISAQGVRRRNLLSLLEQTELLIPSECLTDEVLFAIQAKCRPYVAPNENPSEYMTAYLQEYKNAIAWACARKPNPRGMNMAAFLASGWKLNRRGHVVDEQLLLTAKIAQRIVRFDDLWDLTMKGLPQAKDYENALTESIDMMQHYGFEQRMLETMSAGPLRFAAQPEDAERLAMTMEEGLLKRIHLGESGPRSEECGELVHSLIQNLLRSGLHEAALKFVSSALSKAREHKDRVATLSIAIHSADVFSQHELFTEAQAITSDVVPLLNDVDGFSPGLLIYAFTVIGNVLRYRFHYEQSLKAYNTALTIIDSTHDEKSGAQDRAVLERNMGIVYRDLGHYQKAAQLLEKAAKRQPEDHGIQHNLAVMYQQLNRYREALQCLDRAIALAGGSVNEQIRRPYLVSRALLKRKSDPDAGIDDLRAALKVSASPATKLRVAAAALRFGPNSDEGRKFVLTCRAMLSDAITADMDLDFGLMVVVYTQMAELLLDEGQTDQAGSILTSVIERFAQHREKHPWQMDFVLARLWNETGNYEQCWRSLESAWDTLDRQIPGGADASFAALWLLDKNAYQSRLATIVMGLIERGAIEAETLLALYEFMNGREINSRISADAAKTIPWQQLPTKAAESLQAMANAVDIVFPVETPHETHLFVGYSVAGNWTLKKLATLTGDEVTEVRNSFRAAIKGANPTDLDLLDQQLAMWWKFAGKIGDCLSRFCRSGSHILFLPGRALTGLPLHLVPSGGVPLIEQHTVGYAPNLTVFLTAQALPPSPTTSGYALIVVTGEKDSTIFRQRAVEASNEIKGQLETQANFQLLLQEQADHSAIKEVLGNASEVIFLCHGTTAGPEGGYGICIANEGLLPPRVLSVNEFPAHASFILSWKDIVHSPRVVTSIACSSGLTEVTESGVRFGLEQSLFASGTSTIISPLWDVLQESSLHWLKTLYANRLKHPEWPLVRAYQQTCLDVRNTYSHFYHWAPFIMNGASI